MSRIWNFKKELCCLFGRPVAENPTQHMIEAAFRHHDLDWRYVQFEVAPERLPDAILGFRAMGFRGANCTIPHKLAIIPLLDRLGESASVMGAVNCIVRRGDELIGENTDGLGFVSSLRTRRDPKGCSAVILGAGGAARAIAVELALAGATRLTIVNRDVTRGTNLVDLLRSRCGVDSEFVHWKGDYSVRADADLLVQATSLGLFPDVNARVPVDLASVHAKLLVADVIPNPPRTRLIRDAEARGCTVIDGLEMLVAQGVIGFEHWTGIRAEASVMKAALEEVFGK